MQASVAVACRLNSCGSWTLEHRLNSCGKQTELLYGMWDLPRPGLQPVSPALAGRLFITQPARKHSPSDLNSSLWFIKPGAFIMYSSYKLNKQGNNIQPWCTPFPIWNQSLMSSSNCCFWTRIQFSQIRWSSIPTSLRIFQFFVIHVGFSIVSKTEANIFLELHCFLHDSTTVGNLISIWFLCLF